MSKRVPVYIGALLWIERFLQGRVEAVVPAITGDRRQRAGSTTNY
jgi:hypothetical protein